jgi:hypothetical protein
LTYRLLTFLAIFALVERWGTTLAAGCTVVASLLLLPILLAAYAWIGGAICELWSIYMIAKPESARRCFLRGILAGLALLFRVDLGPAMIASALPLFLFMRAARRWSYLGGAVFARSRAVPYSKRKCSPKRRNRNSLGRLQNLERAK